MRRTDMHEEKREVEWPPPRDDPDEEPSHPGARFDDNDEGWKEKWKKFVHPGREEHHHGPDT
jgi:hypothetical protein